MWLYGDQAAHRAYELATGCQACARRLPATWIQRRTAHSWIATAHPCIAMVTVLVMWTVLLGVLLGVMAVVDACAWLGGHRQPSAPGAGGTSCR